MRIGDTAVNNDGRVKNFYRWRVVDASLVRGGCVNGYG